MSGENKTASGLGQFTIDGRAIGKGAPCFIVAEMGLFHDGSLGAAYSFIDAALEAGADAVKFQMHIADAEGVNEKFRVNMFPQDASRGDYWKRTSFTSEQWKSLKIYSDQKDIIFLCSPFSIEAVTALKEIGVSAWKIASGETNNTPLLEALAEIGDPVLLSTGMSYLEEVDQAVEIFRSNAVPVLLYQCTNRYPCSPEHLGLNMISEYQSRYNLPAGLSDHSGQIAPGIAAVALGANSLEVHVTWSKKCFGPDVASSLTFEQLEELIQGVRFIEEAISHPVNKDEEADKLASTRELFNKSIVLASALSNLEEISMRHLLFKKPCSGILANNYKDVIGKRVKTDLSAGHILQWDDLLD